MPVTRRPLLGPRANALMFGRLHAVVVAVLLVLQGQSAAHAEQRSVVESLYNTIIIEERGSQVFMSFGHNRNIYTQTVFDRADPSALVVPYTRTMTLALAYAASQDSVLEIGAAAGRTSTYLAETFDGIEVTAVELDAEVIALAKQDFGLRDRPNLSIVVQDGRVFLNRTSAAYDVILIDAYRGSFVPFHLVTREFYETARSRLKQGGALALNIEPSSMVYDAALATLDAVFDHVDLYEVERNGVAIAYDGRAISQDELAARTARLDDQHHPRYPLTTMIDGRYMSIEPLDDAPVLTDDFAPVEFLRAVEHHNRPRGEILAEEQ